MIRKSVVTCSLILTICVLTKMFGYSYSTGFVKVIDPIENKVKAQVKKEEKEAQKTVLNFANEHLPMGDKKIDHKMQKALKANSFYRMQTLKLHQRAEKFFPIIEPILAEYGIPDDFKYMPLVESGMAHGRVSPKGAAGLWQFMPQTARDYGLTVNGNIDERNNVRKSTVAAARYIKDLYKIFNSWTLVAAAYNVGEGRLKRQISRQQEDNYYRLKLNKETGKYVYSLISMKEVIENPVKYGYKIQNSRRLLAMKD
jgi:membrane-bound lytic murein transglycosylase D